MTCNIKEKIYSFIENEKLAQAMFCALCASLFCYGLCYPIINEYVAGGFMTVFVVYECLRQHYIPVDLAFIFLWQGALICALIDFHTNDQYMYWLQWAWVLPVVYLFGKVVAGNDNAVAPVFPGLRWPDGRMRIAEKRTTIAFISLALGLFLQGLVDYIYGYIQRGEWFVQWEQFWTGETQVKNTFELEFLLITCLLPAVFYIRRKAKSICFVYLVAEAMILFFCLKTGGRINFLVLMLQVFFIAVFNVADADKIKRRKAVRWLLTLVGVLLILLLVLSLLIKLDLFGIGSIYYNSFWSRDGGVLHNVRLSCIVEGVQKSFIYPLGGFTVDALGEYGGGSSHNLWLEYARQYGLVPLICLFTFSAITVVYAVKLLLKSSDRFSWCKRLLVPAVICLNMYHSMEPNGHAQRHLWLFCIVISGMLARIAGMDQEKYVSCRQDLKQESRLCDRYKIKSE